MILKRKSQRGLTLIELVVAFTILMVLTMMAIPMARYRIRREKERELRLALREMRTAIDKYKDACDGGKVPQPKIDSYCYPDSLDTLVEGVKLANDPKGTKIRFLRRIPRDPFTKSTDWALRSNQDDPKSQGFGGQNVFDVYSKTMEKAPDGTSYSEW
ncbi:MAG: type II secretion system protein [Bryobacteraceae bacterium]